MGKERTRQKIKKTPKELSEESLEESSESEAEKITIPISNKPIKKVQASKRSRRLNKLTQEESKDHKGVIYVGHLPYGFEESGLNKFFAQFGKIVRLIMPRSQKVRKKLNIDGKK